MPSVLRPHRADRPSDGRRAAGRCSRERAWRLVPLVAAAGSAVVLSASTLDGYSAFTARITDSAGAVADGVVTMTQSQVSAGVTSTCASTDGGSVATNSSTCTTISTYGGVTTLVPGETSAASVTVTNTGTHAASSFTLEPGACSQSGTVSGSATDLCSQLLLTVQQTVGGSTTTVLSGMSLDAFRTAHRTGGTSGPLSLGAVPAGGSQTVTLTVTLPAGLGNAYQGLSASQSLTWLFTAGS